MVSFVFTEQFRGRPAPLTLSQGLLARVASSYDPRNEPKEDD